MVRGDRGGLVAGTLREALPRPWSHSLAFVQLRQRYRKIYEDYKPARMYWKEVLLVRKLLFATIVVMGNKNIELQ